MRSFLLRGTVENPWGHPQRRFMSHETIVVRIEYDSTDSVDWVGFALYSKTGARVGGANTHMTPSPKLPKSGTCKFHLQAKTLTPGRYFLNLSLGPHKAVFSDKVDECLGFTVVGPKTEGLINLECSFLGVSQVVDS